MRKLRISLIHLFIQSFARSTLPCIRISHIDIHSTKFQSLIKRCDLDERQQFNTTHAHFRLVIVVLCVFFFYFFLNFISIFKLLTSNNELNKIRKEEELIFKKIRTKIEMKKRHNKKLFRFE